MLRGRLEALGPIFVEAGAPEEALLLQLESEGLSEIETVILSRSLMWSRSP